MDLVKDFGAMPKGRAVEFQGEITYDTPARAARYGGGFSQFVVVTDSTGGIGTNIPVANIEAGFIKGTMLKVWGKIDKYQDKKQPLTENGTYPIRTSVSASKVEEFRMADTFVEKHDHSTEQVMTKEDIVVVDKPAPNYSVAKNVEKEAERIMWAKKDLITAKESACKTVGKWVSDGKIDLLNYFKWCTMLVDYFYNEDEAFDLIVQANLMASGLVEVTKPQITSWLKQHIKGTGFTLEGLDVDLTKATLPELLEKCTQLALMIGDNE